MADKKKQAVVFLADGLEECEGLIVVDLLRRADVHVITASVSGTREILSSHNITFLADALAENVDFAAADMIVLPGGMPGTRNLAASETVKEQCRAFAGMPSEKMIAAICAAPSVLAGLGLLEGKPATCHPGFEDQMAGAQLTGEAVTVADNIITGRGLGAAIPFALELIRRLTDVETAETIAAAICYRG